MPKNQSKHQSQKDKFWVMNKLNQNTGEILIYGDICDYSWWEEDVTPAGFIEDIDNLGEISDINIRINSNGGSVFAAHAIANYLKSRSVTKNVYIDGIAASAATIIAMAGDNIYMSSTSMMMIHDPSVVLWGGYNIKDFNEMTIALNKIKESIVNSYVLKTGIDKDELSNMMSNETWLTGTEAVEKGFADVLLEEDEINMAMEEIQNKRFLVVNKIKFDMSNFKDLSKFNNISTRKTNNSNKEEEQSIMNLEEFKNKYLDLYNQIVQQAINDGAAQERQRIQEIEDVALPGFEDSVKKAKFEKPIDAGQLSMEILKQQKNIGNTVLNNINKDAEELDDIPPVENIDETETDKIRNNSNRISNFFKNKKGDK